MHTFLDSLRCLTRCMSTFVEFNGVNVSIESDQVLDTTASVVGVYILAQCIM